MKVPLFMYIGITLFGCSGNTPTPPPIATYISVSAYPMDHMTENKKGYVLGKAMPDGDGKYTFLLYDDHIVLKTDKTTNFTIDKIDKRYYPTDMGVYVSDPKGERYLITFSKHSYDSNTSIGFYEDYRDSIYNNYTFITCRNVPQQVSEKRNGL